MSRCIKHGPCPKCRELGNDNRGDNLAIYDDGGAHCFACGYHSYPNINYRLQPKVHAKPNTNLLPFDFTREIPTRAWEWLLQYGLPYSYWKAHCGYSPKEERLVFCVGEPLQFSIGRYVGTSGDKPKKWYVWGDCHKHCEVIGTGEKVILVEDLISAHKVAQVTQAIPLFGTKIHKPHLYYLLNTDQDIILWLDKDQEFNSRKTAIRLQSLINKEVKVITTDKDPKCLSLDKIQTTLSESI